MARYIRATPSRSKCCYGKIKQEEEKAREELLKESENIENKDGKSVYHQIVIKHEKRDNIRKELTDNEIGSAIYYETPIHKQPIYEEFGYKLPNSEKFSKEIMSLPSYPQLTDEQALEICECVNKVIG